MNVFLIADGDGVIAYDAGTESMTSGVLEAADRLGGLRRLVLGHSHADHRGTAPALGVPVLCHPDEVAYAERDDGGWPEYFDVEKIPVWYSRRLYPLLLRRWDGGRVRIDDTLIEGDTIGGFEVLHMPGHAPGQIALWRERDRVALVSDVVYMVDAVRLRAIDAPSVPSWVFNQDTAIARESIRRLAEYEPALVCPGHSEPIRGDPAEVRRLLEAAAARVA